MLTRVRFPGAPPTSAACHTGFEEVAAVMAVASTAVSVAGQAAQAHAQQQELNYQSAVAKQQGQEQMAAASYEGAQAQRQAALAIERTQAVAAASGVSDTSPSVLKDEGNIAGQGEYNKLMKLAIGANQQSGYNEQAAADVYQASQIGQAATYNEFGTILGGASNFYSKYGAGLMGGGANVGTGYGGSGEP